MNRENSNYVSRSSSIFVKRSMFGGRSVSEEGSESSSSGCPEDEQTLSSPVTNLTFNLQVLSTHGAEPKFVRRKLSLTSSSSFSESSENVRSPLLLQRHFSSDDGCCIDSPGGGSDCHESMSYDSPFLQNWDAPPLQSKHQENKAKGGGRRGGGGGGGGLKRFNSVPVFEMSNSSSLRTTFSLTSVKEVDLSHVVELRRGDENKENEGVAGDLGPKKSVSFKLPTSPAPRGIIISPFKDETNSPAFLRRTGGQCAGGRGAQAHADDFLYKSPKMSANAYSRHLHRTLSRKLSSDDGFLERLEDDANGGLDPCGHCQGIPKGLEGLFFSPVLETSESSVESSPATIQLLSSSSSCRAAFSGDAMEGQESAAAPSLARGLFRSPSAPKMIRRKYSAQEVRISYKRSESHTQDSDLTPLQLKRWKGGLARERGDGGKGEKEREEEGGVGGEVGPRRMIMRCHSETEIFIKTALSWADSQQNLIGDFTKPFCLPLVNGKHQDLKAISPDTMAAIVNNQYKDVIEDCIVVDCRYPYEFYGGHIPGARNVYTTDDLIEMFFTSNSSSRASEAVPSPHPPHPHPLSGSMDKRRSVVIFHCEFSSERGPKLSRFLRNHDRDANIDSYPSLRYPEIYVLEGGYKAFYESFPLLCEPHGYVPMLHQDHLIELKQFRSKSSSWATADKGGRAVGRKTVARPSLNL